MVNRFWVGGTAYSPECGGSPRTMSHMPVIGGCDSKEKTIRMVPSIASWFACRVAARGASKRPTRTSELRRAPSPPGRSSAALRTRVRPAAPAAQLHCCGATGWLRRSSATFSPRSRRRSMLRPFSTVLYPVTVDCRTQAPLRHGR
jgi:hypothetical protein